MQKRDFVKYPMHVRKSLTYDEKLALPEWKEMADKIRSRDKFICQKHKELGRMVRGWHVHHRWYQGKRKLDRDEYLPWEFPEEDLTTLCDDCHDYETDNYYIAVPSLNRIIKSLFFTDQIAVIDKAFRANRALNLGYNPIELAKALHYCLSTPDEVHELLKRHRKSTYKPMNDQLSLFKGKKNSSFM